MRIYDMKVNHLTSPLGFRISKRFFRGVCLDAGGLRGTYEMRSV